MFKKKLNNIVQEFLTRGVPYNRQGTLANEANYYEHVWNGHHNTAALNGHHVTSVSTCSGRTCWKAPPPAPAATVRYLQTTPGCHGDSDSTSSSSSSWCVSVKDLRQIGRAVFVEVDLDSIANNFRLLKAMCRNKNIGVVGVVKGNGYGHGAIPVARHLLSTGAVDRLAVANVAEAIQLRNAGINGIIHILGNVQSWEMTQCVRYRLTPTVASLSAVRGMSEALAAVRRGPMDRGDSTELREDFIDRNSTLLSYCKASPTGHADNCCDITDSGSTRTSSTNDGVRRCHCCPTLGAVHIKVDTGMSRNGCQPCELPALVEACKLLDVPLEGIFSHISNHEDPNYSKYQLDNFLDCISPYRNDGYIFHIANSGAVLYDIGTELDLIRPGISAFGMPSGPDLQAFVDMGFKPALSVRGTPTLVKFCSAGTKVGYACTYTCPTDEWIGTFPLGYADGLWRQLGELGTHIIRDRTGERCPVVGRISMDAITVRLPCRPEPRELFTIVTADFDPVTSVTGIAETIGTIQNEILIRFSSRLPRVYRNSSSDAILDVLAALDLSHDLLDCDVEEQVNGGGVGHHLNGVVPCS